MGVREEECPWAQDVSFDCEGAGRAVEEAARLVLSGLSIVCSIAESSVEITCSMDVAVEIRCSLLTSAMLARLVANSELSRRTPFTAV